MILLGRAPGQTPLGSTAPPPFAPAKPTFHAESRLVVVDVVVTRHGRPVTGLSKTDFTILDDGERQDISVFEPHAFHQTATSLPVEIAEPNPSPK